MRKIQNLRSSCSSAIVNSGRSNGLCGNHGLSCEGQGEDDAHQVAELGGHGLFLHHAQEYPDGPAETHAPQVRPYCAAACAVQRDKEHQKMTCSRRANGDYLATRLVGLPSDRLPCASAAVCCHRQCTTRLAQMRNRFGRVHFAPRQLWLNVYLLPLYMWGRKEPSRSDAGRAFSVYFILGDNST